MIITILLLPLGHIPFKKLAAFGGPSTSRRSRGDRRGGVGAWDTGEGGGGAWEAVAATACRCGIPPAAVMIILRERREMM
jgi:hypothetical protein